MLTLRTDSDSEGSQGTFARRKGMDPESWAPSSTLALKALTGKLHLIVDTLDCENFGSFLGNAYMK